MKKSFTTLLGSLAVTALCGSAAHAQTYQQVWADEFNGTSVNTANWKFETGGGGWGNNEKQYYQASNATVANGELQITARKENVGGMPYTSARMVTNGLKSFTYGKMEARIRVPLGQGLWPAFWMLGSNIGSVGWPKCGEIDIMEQVNTDSRTYGTAHWDNNGHAQYGQNIAMSANTYHVYSVEWTPTAIKWFMDGTLYNTMDITNGVGGTDEFQRSFFLLLNLAVAGDWPGQTVDESKLPATMSVDYVRVYQLGSGPAPQAVPGTIQAESFSAQSGTQLEATTDAGGGQNVDYFEANDWLDYTVNVQTAGTYTVGFRVASANGGVTLQLRNSGGGVLGSVNVGNTGGWQSWQTQNATVTLPAGVQTLRVFASASTGCNLNYLTFTAGGGGTAFTRQLEAEAANVNNGMVVEGCSEGGQDMGYIDAGDYLVWNGVNFPTSGAYKIEYRVASGAAGGTISSDLNAGSIQLGNTTIPGTGGWQTWTTVSRTVNVNAGTYNFACYAQTGGYNLNWVRITKVAAKGALATANGSTRTMEIYPNPVTDRLSISSELSLSGSGFRILNALGQRVATGTLQSNVVDVAGLPAGVYTFEVATKDQATITRRFVK